MATKTQGKQRPYGFRGTVTVDGSVYQGAEIWLQDLTDGQISPSVVGKTRYFTGTDGKYLLNLGDAAQASAIGDSVMVFCKAGDIISSQTVTTSNIGYNVVNFTLTTGRGSVSVDGLHGSSLANRQGGLHKELRRDMVNGLV